MTYKVLLADDEAEIRDGMKKRIPWEELGFELVALAENGIEALEAAEETQPDLVITDIQMPFLDGLSFIESLIVKQPNVKIIIFSGYDLFEYAQKAISLKVRHYLLKPFSSKELSQILLEVKKELETENQQKQFLLAMESKITPEDQQVALVKKFLFHDDLLTDQEKNQCSFLLAGDRLRIVIMGELYKANDEDVSTLASLKVLGDLALGKHFTSYSFLHHDKLVYVLNFSKQEQENLLLNILKNITQEAKNSLDHPFFVGVGVDYPLVEKKKAYQTAKEAFQYTKYQGNVEQPVVTYREIKDHGHLEIQEKSLSNIVKTIILQDEAGIEGEIHQFFHQKLRESTINEAEFHFLIIQLGNTLAHFSQEYHLNQEEAILHEMKHRDFRHLPDLEQWVLQVSCTLAQEMGKKRQKESSSLVQKVKEYVKEHYADSDLSVDNLSKIFYFSPAYFSSQFKKETGESFMKYLTTLRLEKAISYILTTELKTYEIAEKVGYTQSNYFSYVLF